MNKKQIQVDLTIAFKALPEPKTKESFRKWVRSLVNNEIQNLRYPDVPMMKGDGQ